MELPKEWEAIAAEWERCHGSPCRTVAERCYALANDSNEALQVMGLKLAHAEAENARLRVDAGRLDWLEDNSYALPYKDHGAGPELDLSRPAIDALMKDQNHSANTVGGPTPVMDAAPACERKE